MPRNTQQGPPGCSCADRACGGRTRSPRALHRCLGVHGIPSFSKETPISAGVLSGAPHPPSSKLSTSRMFAGRKIGVINAENPDSINASHGRGLADASCANLCFSCNAAWPKSFLQLCSRGDGGCGVLRYFPLPNTDSHANAGSLFVCTALASQPYRWRKLTNTTGTTQREELQSERDPSHWGSQQEPGGARAIKEETEGVRKSQKKPGGARDTRRPGSFGLSWLLHAPSGHSQLPLGSIQAPGLHLLHKAVQSEKGRRRHVAFCGPSWLPLAPPGFSGFLLPRGARRSQKKQRRRSQEKLYWLLLALPSCSWLLMVLPGPSRCVNRGVNRAQSV